MARSSHGCSPGFSTSWFSRNSITYRGISQSVGAVMFSSSPPSSEFPASNARSTAGVIGARSRRRDWMAGVIFPDDEFFRFLVSEPELQVVPMGSGWENTPLLRWQRFVLRLRLREEGERLCRITLAEKDHCAEELYGTAKVGGFAGACLLRHD